MAGKFNLNQLLTDVSKSVAPGGTIQPTAGRADNEIVYLSVYDIVPSEENFYSMNDIDELKEKIRLTGKVLQNLVVVPLTGGKYKAIAGHRRRLASIALVEEGEPQYEFVPCVIEANEADAEAQAIREEIMLIATNSQREKTAWDKLEEVRRTRALMEKIKQQEKIPGGTRDLVAKTLHTSSTQIGRFDAILKNLCPDFMDEIKQGRINISTAYELSGLSEEEQQAAFAIYRVSGTISIKTAQDRKKPEPDRTPQEPPLPGQMNFDGNTYGEGRPKAEQETPSTMTEPVQPALPEVMPQKPQPVPPAPQKAAMTATISRLDEIDETRCVDEGICPYCKRRFDAAKAVNYSIEGTDHIGPVECPHCGQPIEIFCSVEYVCCVPEN